MIIKRIVRIIIYFLTVTILTFSACRKDDFDTDPGLRLGFSTDTVMFDTVFTTIGSSTRALVIRNSSDQRINISKITLARGKASPFRINVDGTATEEYQQLLQSATLDEDRRMCLFALFNINALGLRDRNEAQSYLTQLQNQFPSDVRTGVAAIRFRGMIDESRAIGMQKSMAGNNKQVQLPFEFSLSQNYPNPFNPVTIVTYALPVDTHTHLKIYDILGREVISLVDENMPAGYHQSTFDASGFSSGVYFYRMEAGSFASVKKLLLLK